MANDTQSGADLQTSGYVERRILNQLVSDEGQILLSATASEIADETEATNASVRRALNRLEKKGLVQRLDDLDEEQQHQSRFETAKKTQSRDGRSTNWVITEEGEQELKQLDDQYRRELHKLMRRYGRRRISEITQRIT